MAVQIKQRMPVQEFDRYVLLPENSEHIFEYIGGEVYAVVSNNYSSEVAARIMTFIGMFVLKFKLGRLTGADGGYIIAGERYIPDVAYTTYARQPHPSHDAYNPTPPDLAIEVLSPTNDDEKMRVKVTNYLLEGVTVWVVNPLARTVEIYAQGQPVKIIGENDVLEGGDILPGFQLNVAEIFPAEVES